MDSIKIINIIDKDYYIQGLAIIDGKLMDIVINKIDIISKWEFLNIYGTDLNFNKPIKRYINKNLLENLDTYTDKLLDMNITSLDICSIIHFIKDILMQNILPKNSYLLYEISYYILTDDNLYNGIKKYLNNKENSFIYDLIHSNNYKLLNIIKLNELIEDKTIIKILNSNNIITYLDYYNRYCKYGNLNIKGIGEKRTKFINKKLNILMYLL